MKSLPRLCLICLGLLLLANAEAADYVPQTGDIIFHTSTSQQSLAIQRATGSRYSHVGLVVIRNGKPYVFEAVEPVKLTALAHWIARGKGQRFVVKRLKNGLTATQQQKLIRAGKPFLGKHYDLTFEWSDQKIYCSELVWKVYQNGLGIELSTLRQLQEFKLDDPAVAPMLKKRYGKQIPLEEPVVAPADLFESERLVEVARG